MIAGVGRGTVRRLLIYGVSERTQQLKSSRKKRSQSRTHFVKRVGGSFVKRDTNSTLFTYEATVHE